MNKQEKIKLLQDIIKMRSVNGNENEVAFYLKNLLAHYGIESNLIAYSTDKNNLVTKLS